MNLEHTVTTTIPGAWTRVPGLIANKDHYVVTTTGETVPRGKNLQGLVDAMAILEKDLKAGHTLRISGESNRSLPCGRKTPQIYWSPAAGQLTLSVVLETVNYRFNTHRKVEGFPSATNESYEAALSELIELRNEVIRSEVTPLILGMLRHRIEVIKKYQMGQALVVKQEPIKEKSRYAYSMESGARELFGVSLPIGIARNGSRSLKVTAEGAVGKFYFDDFEHPLLALRVACTTLLAFYRKSGIPRLNKSGIGRKRLPHGKSEKHIYLFEGVVSSSLRVNLTTPGRGNDCQSFSFRGPAGIDNPDYMLKLGQAIRYRDRAVKAQHNKALDDIHAVIREIDEKLKEEGIDGTLVESKPTTPLDRIIPEPTYVNIQRELPIDRDEGLFHISTNKEVVSDETILLHFAENDFRVKIDTNKKGQLKLYENVPGTERKLISVTMLDYEDGQQQVIGSYKGMDYEIRVRVGGGYLWIRSNVTSNRLEYDLVEV